MLYRNLCLMRIPVLMCHGIDPFWCIPLTVEHFARLMKIAKGLGFESINYDDLERWQNDEACPTKHPIIIDFDHPVKSIRYEVNDILKDVGFNGNLFINTGFIDDINASFLPPGKQTMMNWDEVRDLLEDGWHIGAHTVNHPNLSKLSLEDPDGEKLRNELDECNKTIEKQLGITPKDFAFTGISISTIAIEEVSKRYRYGRLWIKNKYYEMDGKQIRYADLVGVPGEDEPDGGPPMAARYIYKDTNHYQLPSVDMQGLIHQPEAFTAYLKGALEDSVQN